MVLVPDGLANEFQWGFFPGSLFFFPFFLPYLKKIFFFYIFLFLYLGTQSFALSGSRDLILEETYIRLVQVNF